MTGTKFRNWLMFWLFHKAQPFNFKEKTLPLESVSWHGIEPLLNYAKNVATAHTIAENLEKHMQYITQNKVFLAVAEPSNHRLVLMKMLMSITEKLQSLKAISTRLWNHQAKSRYAT